MLVAAVGVHDEDLVTFERIAVRLEDELGAVGGEIGFGVLAAESELADVAEMFLGLCGRWGGHVLWGRGCEGEQSEEERCDQG